MTTSTDPGWFTTREAVASAPSEVLVEVRADAERQHRTAGGHGHAARMLLVVSLIDQEMADRALRASTSEALLAMAYRLTRRMQIEKDSPHTDDLRAQRDLVTEEVLRRINGGE